MAISGGVITEFTMSHPTAGTKVFAGIKDGACTYTIPGYMNENSVDGQGRIVSSKQPKLGGLDIVTSNDASAETPEFEYLQACMNSTEMFTCVVANAGGFVYQGQGLIGGDVEMDGDKATVHFKADLQSFELQ